MKEKQRKYNVLKSKDREDLLEIVWEIYLIEGEKGVVNHLPVWQGTIFHWITQFLHILPSDPRCIWCGSPFRGAAAPLMRAIGKTQSSLNPSMCMTCETALIKTKEGADVNISMVFADIRGSTELSERLSPQEFQQLINRFFSETSKVIIGALGFVDKFVGDEVTSYFIPGFAGEAMLIRRWKWRRRYRTH